MHSSLFKSVDPKHWNYFFLDLKHLSNYHAHSDDDEDGDDDDDSREISFGRSWERGWMRNKK